MDRVENLEIDIIDIEETEIVEKPGTEMAAKNPCKSMAVREVVVQLFLFSFCKVSYLFFFFSELITSGFLVIFSTLFIVDNFVE